MMKRINELSEAELRQWIKQNREDLLDPTGADERAELRRQAEQIRRQQAEKRREAIRTVVFRNPKHK